MLPAEDTLDAMHAVFLAISMAKAQSLNMPSANSIGLNC
jgi:hypothetical protein